MSSTISTRDAKQRWNDIVDSVRNGEDVLVETDGEPQVVMISPETYRELQALRDQQRRSEAVARIEALQRRQAERNKNLSDEEIDEIAIQVGREVNTAVTKRWRESLDAVQS